MIRYFTLPIADMIPPAGELAQAAGRGVFNEVKLNLVRKDDLSSPAPGMPKTGYYGDAANATTVEWSGTGAKITVAKEGMALHYYGGTVLPGKGKKALAIPKNPAVAGMRAAEFDPGRDKLALVWPKKSKAGTLRDKETGKVLYLLIPKATIPADPSVLPDDGAMWDAARDAMEALRC